MDFIPGNCAQRNEAVELQGTAQAPFDDLKLPHQETPGGTHFHKKMRLHTFVKKHQARSNMNCLGLLGLASCSDATVNGPTVGQPKREGNAVWIQFTKSNHASLLRLVSCMHF